MWVLAQHCRLPSCDTELLADVSPQRGGMLVIRAGIWNEAHVQARLGQTKRQLLVFADSEVRIETTQPDQVSSSVAGRVCVDEINVRRGRGMAVAAFIFELNKTRKRCLLVRQVHALCRRD